MFVIILYLRAIIGHAIVQPTADCVSVLNEYSFGAYFKQTFMQFSHLGAKAQP